MGQSCSEVADQVERLTAHPLFARCPRMIRFLRLCVERALAGEPLKEFVVAVEVFDKKPDFDTRLNPLVRVEARRLRQKLREYYAGDGRYDPVRIDMPEGCYVPCISFTSPAALNHAPPEPPESEEEPSRPPPRELARGAPAGLGARSIMLRPADSRGPERAQRAPAPAAPQD